ncbi:hypothetical protein [Paenibacillus sp. YYML68]|uniref:hypothetical protein n=1 Tax=Paenibacillus sp. YYML68 TaxID=2909250 RepID=UPI00248F8ECC|nr:hypothetical protein [Paenibacillus sp. YYML68]
MKLVEMRISDRRILKLVRKWLGAGVVEEGNVRRIVGLWTGEEGFDFLGMMARLDWYSLQRFARWYAKKRQRSRWMSSLREVNSMSKQYGLKTLL